MLFKQAFLRQISLGVSLGAGMLFSICPQALADDAARVHYNDGTMIETSDFNLKLNMLIQPNFSYTDYDSDGRAALGLDPLEDSASFDVRRTRLRLGGDFMQKTFSYVIYTDLRSDDGGSELQDAYIQWNSDDVKARWGQFNVPFSRQKLNTDHGMQMVDRSLTSDTFSMPREMGFLLHGPLGGSATYAAGVYNGEEGINQAGTDNKLLYTAALTASTDGYGSRGFEGDLREDNSSLEATGGVAAYYFESDDDGLGKDQFALNVDLGAKAAGLSGQTEFYYRSREFDDDSDSLDDFGFYAQGGYMLDRQWELAARFGYIDLDELSDEDSDTQEYSGVVNYYLKGHNLKIQTGVNFIVNNVGDEDTSDFQFITQLTGFV